VRLGILIPGLFIMQARAIVEAALDRLEAGGDPQPEIMVPLVASVRELEIVRAEIDQQIAEVEEERGVKLDIAIGTMIELPRAAFLANRIAKSADFFSFGTNDLTQMAWGFSRDDVEASFFSRYFEHGIFDVSPFESLDQLGVGGMVEMGTKKGRKTKPDLKVGVCGEHGGDPLSVHFFDQVGLNYVSCSPFRVPVARLEAGRAVLGKRDSEER
jgi:pyruvate,orthophosphate dikinase